MRAQAAKMNNLESKRPAQKLHPQIEIDTKQRRNQRKKRRCLLLSLQIREREELNSTHCW